MSEASPSSPLVALVAADEAGVAALRPAREMLAAFGVAWQEALLPGAAGVGTFDATRLRAIVVASADAGLPSALALATRLPVVRVPIPDGECSGIDLLRDEATANLPAGEGPFATVAIGEAGAKNAALFIVSILGLNDPRLWSEWLAFRERQTDAVLGHAPLAEL